MGGLHRSPLAFLSIRGLGYIDPEAPNSMPPACVWTSDPIPY